MTASNSYFDWGSQSRFIRFDTVRAEDANAALDLVTQGFNMLPIPAALWGESGNYATAGGTANAITASVAATYLTALADGLTVRIRATAANTTNTTFNLNGLGAKPLLRPSGAALQANDVSSGQVCQITYIAALDSFQLASFATSTTPGPAGPAAYNGRVSVTANRAVTVADVGKLLDCNTSDSTLTFDSAASLTSLFECWIAAVAVTVTISSSDGATNWKMYPGEVRRFYGDGTTVRSKIVQAFKYTPAASATFIEPPGYAGYDVYLQAPGGGGGSGRKGAAASLRFGGGSGGGGASARSIIAFGAAGASITLTVGAAGTGGAAVTASSTDGNAGTSGGTTSFGTLLVAAGGAAGGAGSTTAGAAGAAGTAAASPGLAGTAGGAGTSNAVGVAGTASTQWAATGGGSGGGINAADTVSAGGGAGGTSGTDTASNQLAGGTGATSSAVATAGAQSTQVPRRGGSGGGGGCPVAGFTTAGNGARGGGGGGGAAGLNASFDSGRGGDGGAAYVEIIGVL